MMRKGLLVALAGLLAAAPCAALDCVLHSRAPEELATHLPAGAVLSGIAARGGRLRADLPSSSLPALAGLRRAGLLDWWEPNHEVVAMDLEGDARIWVDPIAADSLADQAIQGQPGFVQTGIAGLREVTDGAGTIVAIVDTGADYGHPDATLTDRLLAGRDFVNGDLDAQDDQGHGTRVAGVLVAILPGADILPVKALGAAGTGTIYDVAEGIEWAADQGAVVINLSLGGPEDSQTLREAISYAESQGAIVVASAGNVDTSVPQYPAAILSVVAVAGVDLWDVRADFAAPTDGWASSYGSHVDVSAPAIDVKTTSWPADFVAADGTSYAAAIVSAILAGEKAVGKTNAEAEEDLETTAADIDDENPGFAGLLGSGRSDGGGAIQ